MAKLTLSHDLLAACLILVDGDINASIEEMLSRADDFQEEQNRHFGISRSDLRGMFLYWTTFDLGIRKYADTIDDIKLRDVINLMLEYQYAAFNDEGESLGKRDEVYDSFVGYWFDLDENQYQDKMRVKNKMREFFRDVETKDISGKDVMEFLNGMGVTLEILIECSRPGESS